MMGSRHAPPRPPEPGAASSARRSVALACTVLVLAVFAAYANSLSGPFVYDDKDSIADNLTLRRLWPLSEALAPPSGDLTVSGRPALNLSLAFNFAAGGLDVRGYHAVNVLIHALACLTLFGLARRTLALPSLRARFGGAAVPFAFAVAALWALHPLQTEGVTYIVQRAESLMGLFYLLTLYGFVRSLDAPAPGRWQAASVAACLLGMATKENMVSAPVLALLLDRAFVAGSFAEAWRRRRGFYAALAMTWILLGWLLVSTGGNRGGSAGFGVDISWRTYVLTQFPALVHYLRLSFWPTPLIFAYDTYWIGRLANVWLQACLVLALVAGTLSAWWRIRAVGFLGAWFFAVLAPTSLIPGTTQQIVEHRMYLPLAPVMVLIVAAVHLRSGRRGLAALLALAAGLGWLTIQRNADYRSEIALWSDTVAKQPANASAHSGLGAALADAGRIAEAIREDETTLRLRPNYLTARNNLGAALIAAGRVDEAIQHLEASLRQDPDDAQAHLNLGVALDLLQRTPEAMAHYEAALRRDPNSARAHANLGDALSRSGRSTQGIVYLREALRLKPGYVDAHYNLAAALARSGRLEEAQAEFAAGLRLKPANAAAHANWASVLLATGRPAEALAQFESALRLQPESAANHYNYGCVLASAGRLDEAVRQFETALRLKPGYVDAHYNLAAALARAGRLEEAQAEFAAGLRLKPADAEAYAHWGGVLLAIGRPTEAMAQFESALRLQPASASNHYNYGSVLAATGRLDEAVLQFEAALRLKPDYVEAHNNLGNALTLLGREAEALPHYEAALQLNPGHPSAHNNLGLALARLGRLPEAAAQFAEALRLAPDYQDARDNLARAQEQLRAAPP